MQALISESRGTLGLQACQRNDAPDSEGHGSTATEPASQRGSRGWMEEMVCARA